MCVGRGGGGGEGDEGRWCVGGRGVVVCVCGKEGSENLIQSLTP